ncbi:MAG: MlaC/ttg2D family ABC transporter substrate-binding protein [Planctomycetota bacterium]|jgi:phospholipid transport system substrate-binding protein
MTNDAAGALAPLAIRRAPRLRRAPLALCLVALIGLSGQVAAQDRAGDSPPVKVMRKALDRIVVALHDDGLTNLAKRDAVQAAVNDNLDIYIVSRLVLAKNWKKFDEAQRDEFAVSFRRHLVNTYWRNAKLATFERIDIVDDREEARGDWTVKSVIRSESAGDVKVDYRMRREALENDELGEWKIIDVIVEGVSLVSNFRSQFQEIVANDGPGKVLELLRESNAKADKTEAKESAPVREG